MNKSWWRESAIYQIYPRSFKDSDGDGIGDIKGVISKLDYLKELGINVIWLSPVYKSPNDDNGYDISDYYDIMDEFGTMADFDQLLDQAHQRGIKIIMDLVVNHTSDEHVWFQASKSSKDNPYRNYYYWHKGKDGKEPNNWESAFSGSAWKYDQATDEYFLHLFSQKQPDLNWENPKVRQEIYKMMKWWLDKGIDGFRMDVINFISKVPGLPDGDLENGKKYASGAKYFMNGPRIHEFLQEMNHEVLSKYDIITVGETPGVTPDQAKDYTGEKRDELNMVFHFEHVGLGDGPKGKWSNLPWKLTELKEIMSKWQTELEGDGWNSLYLNNHDQPRAVSRFGHDGEYRVESAKMLATFLHMMKGTPYIYQGEEIGMTNVKFRSIEEYRDIETLNYYKEAVEENGEQPDRIMKEIYTRSRDNARTPVQWDDSEHAGFTTGTPWISVNPNYKQINVKNARDDNNSVYHYYKKLLELRKQHEVIVYGSYKLLLEDNEEIYAFTRTLGKEQLLIILNFSEEKPNFLLPKEFDYLEPELLISNYDVNKYEQQNLGNFQLKPFEARVYLIKN